jgi:hypothetical protein
MLVFGTTDCEMTTVPVKRVRTFLTLLVGLRYVELPFGIRREDIDAALLELQAQKSGESGTPGFEVNNEYFRIGRRKVRVCTEDEMLVSLWGSKPVVNALYERILSRSKA